MSRVWLAFDETTDLAGSRPAHVVAKHCTIPRGLSPGQHELVRDWALPEAAAASRVRHPNVIRTLDVLPSRDGPWLIMEHLAARSLHRIVEESGPVSPARAAVIGLAVLSALEAAGHAGVLHLDVKPGNVLIAARGRAVLTDFGLAVTPAGVRTLADAGVILGSPKYIAPERVFEHVSDARSDLWSLGATLYYAVEGRSPFRRATTAEVLQAVGEARPEPPQRAGPLLPVLAGLLRRDPADRITAAEVETHLRGIVEAGRRRPRAVALRRIPVVVAAVAVAATLSAVAATAEGVTRPGAMGAAPGSPVTVPAIRPSIAPPRVPAPPDGYTWRTGPGGYRVAVPAGWRQVKPSPSPDGVTFSGRKHRAVLGITPLAEPPGDVLAALRAAETESDLAGYRRLRMETLPEPSAAVWEYTFEDPDGTPMHALRRLTSSGGRTYMIEWRATREAWPTELARFTVVLASFSPAA
ncbi:serine/threonine-protein kinase [Actinoplanes sandaracinus]|nr:serine/threonine-protein kinase [Actinoplanes sandaracinus]